MNALVYVHAGSAGAAAVLAELFTHVAEVDPEPGLLATGAQCEAACGIAAAHGAAWASAAAGVQAWDSDAAVTLLAEAVRERGVTLLVGPERRFERDVLSRLAMRLGAPVLRAGTALESQRVRLRAGAADVWVSLDQGAPLAITMLPWSVAPKQRPRSPRVEMLKPTADPRRSNFVERLPSTDAPLPLGHATALLVGGRGLGEPEGFAELGRLVDRIPRSAVGATAPVVTGGAADRAHLVGISGVRCSPRLYAGFGVSGAFFHEVGVRGAGHVLSVNRNPHAPLSRDADLSIAADAASFVRDLVRALDGRTSRSGAETG